MGAYITQTIFLDAMIAIVCNATPDLYAEMQSSTQQKMDQKCNYFPKVQQIGIISVAVHYPN
jgi:hypothetical protein